MPSICDKCRRGRQGPRPPLPAGTGGELYEACPQFKEFHTRLCQAVSVGQQLLDIVKRLEIPEARVNTTSSEDVASAWTRVLRLAAQGNQLPQLAKLAGSGPGKAAYQLESLVQEASCGFVNFRDTNSVAIRSSSARPEHDYLRCDRKDEWDVFSAARDSNAIVPLIAIGPKEEALDKLRLRVVRCLENHNVVAIDWEADYRSTERYERMQKALAQTLATHASAKTEEVAELLKTTSPTVLLHPLLTLRHDSPESDSDERYLLEYYEQLARDLSRLSPEYPAPYVVQFIVWEDNELDRAQRVADEIARRLATVQPRPQVIQYALKPIVTEDVENFLRNRGKLSLWPRVRRDIHRINWPVVMGRKSSRDVYEALLNAFSGSDAESGSRT